MTQNPSLYIKIKVKGENIICRFEALHNLRASELPSFKMQSILNNSALQTRMTKARRSVKTGESSGLLAHVPHVLKPPSSGLVACREVVWNDPWNLCLVCSHQRGWGRLDAVIKNIQRLYNPSHLDRTDWMMSYQGRLVISLTHLIWGKLKSAFVVLVPIKGILQRKRQNMRKSGLSVDNRSYLFTSETAWFIYGTAHTKRGYTWRTLRTLTAAAVPVLLIHFLHYSHVV